MTPAMGFLLRMVSSPEYRRIKRRNLADQIAKQLGDLLDVADDCDLIIDEGGEVPFSHRLMISFEIGQLRAQLQEVDDDEHYDYLIDPTHSGDAVRRYIHLQRLQEAQRGHPPRE